MVTRSLVAALVMLLGTALATTYTALSLEEIAQRAELAFLGTVTEVEVEERGGDPWTVVTFAVERSLLGDILDDDGEVTDALSLAFYGGSLSDGSSLIVNEMPGFVPGEEVILLAYGEPYYSPIVGFSQGLWRLTEAGFRDEQGRVLSLDEEGVLLPEGSGAGTEELLTALEALLEANP